MPNIHLPSLLLAAAALSGCFAPEESDNPYTRLRGEVFQNLQLEVTPEGDLLVMTRMGMVYEYEGEEPTRAGQTMTRNFHSVLYRRTRGSWNATPFRNIQQQWTSLPALVPDSEGNYHAFIRDAGKVLRYRPEGGGWVRASAGRLESARDVLVGGTALGRNSIALRGESNVVFCRQDWGEGIEVQGVAGARGSFFLDTSENTGIDEIRAAPGFIGVLGRKNFTSEEDMQRGIFRMRAVYWYWHPDDSAATAVVLPDSAHVQARFLPYRDGLGLLVVREDGFYMHRLSPAGELQDRFLLAPRNFRERPADTVAKDTTKPVLNSGWTTTPSQTFSHAEVDGRGCVHILDRRSPEYTYRGVKLYYANSCTQLREVEIPLPTGGLGDSPAELFDADMKVDSAGKVRVAVTQTAYGESGGFNRSYGYAPSRLLIAELGEAGWTVEIAATK